MERNFRDRKMRKEELESWEMGILHQVGPRPSVWLWQVTVMRWGVTNYGSFTTDFNERRIWFSYSRLLIFSSVKQDNYPYLMLWWATKSTMNFYNRSCYETQHLGKIPELALSEAAPELAARQPHQLRYTVHYGRWNALLTALTLSWSSAGFFAEFCHVS